MNKWATQFWQGIVALVYPRNCIVCNHSLLVQEHVLCIACSSELPFTNYHQIAENETAARFAGRLQFERATSLFYFTKDGTVQELLHQFKYNNDKSIGVWMAAKFAQELKKTNWADGIDYIVPIPLHIKKQSKRGFNQSEVLALELSRHLSIKMMSDAVKRVVNTDSQTTKSRTQRSENLKEAFQLTGQSDILACKHILIIDDVLTTGATIDACAQILLNVPNIKISVATIGIAV